MRLLLAPCLIQAALAWRSTREAGRSGVLEGYTFAHYVKDFARSYAPGSEEFRQRSEYFEASLVQLRRRKEANLREGRLWRAGLHPFMDWSEVERAALVSGYKPQRPRAARAVSLLHQGGRAQMNSSLAGADAVSGGLDLEDGPAVRQQGNCGSCWAISAVEALEAQLLKSGTAPPRIAAQALVDCVPNPQHCGGSGGCEGATGELAYAFVRDHGIPLETELPYTAQTGTCPQGQVSGLWPSRRVRLDGWAQLPSNELAPLKAAIVQQGPAVVAVDGSSWFDYEAGIFDSCQKDAILGHAVLAKGFGEENGRQFWLIQNSWGRDWGEQGHIRLLMQSGEEQWCGVDNKPQDGVGCDGGPSEIKVCGACGILYDGIVPQGVRIEEASATGADAKPPLEQAEAAEAAAGGAAARMAALLNYKS